MGTTTNVINFFGIRCEHGWCSNFAAYPVTIDGITWPTSEHYYQAQKFLDEAFRERIRSYPAPGAAKKIGSSNHTEPRRADWDSVRNEVMHRVVLAKFTQHAELRDKLLATGEAQLVEHSARDAYWGDGGDGTGQNMLGQILMRVREELGGGV